MGRVNAVRRGDLVWLWCPGCEDVHCIDSERWTFDGDMVRPSISPSILVRMYGFPHGIDPAPGEIQKPGEQTCHSFVRGGVWEFLSDCTHSLAGQHVAMADVEPQWPWGDDH